MARIVPREKPHPPSVEPLRLGKMSEPSRGSAGREVDDQPDARPDRAIEERTDAQDRPAQVDRLDVHRLPVRDVDRRAASGACRPPTRRSRQALTFGSDGSK
jgi:hypothetical protein